MALCTLLRRNLENWVLADCKEATEAMSRIQICLLYSFKMVTQDSRVYHAFLKIFACEKYTLTCHLSCSTFLLIVHTFWTIIPWKMHTKTLRFSHCHSFAKYIFMQTWHLWVFWRVFDKTDRPDWFPPFVLWISLLVYFWGKLRVNILTRFYQEN